MSANLTVSTFSLGIYPLSILLMIRNPWPQFILSWMVGLLPDDPIFQYDRDDSSCLYGDVWS
jgi:hypothetical protein